MAISKTNGVWIEDRKLFVKTASFDQKRKELLKHNPNKNASENIAIKKVMGENINENFGPYCDERKWGRKNGSFFKW
ncbi:hypothetical protein RHGRI_037200 [Rhododendron griersonianum]|uniref:Uncharacterized protein n=1 Tax=Rhododendron griersonianum TaxID=479676 RepID=A0AAV6HQW4_9ERIC|nr:hypothetical protein RHGRI_037200 [Rhododendron griersonianum]